MTYMAIGQEFTLYSFQEAKYSHNVFGLHGKVLVAEGYNCDFSVKLIEASPVSDRDNASWIQGGLTAGQGIIVVVEHLG